jgi:hypothetical protein
MAANPQRHHAAAAAQSVHFKANPFISQPGGPTWQVEVVSVTGLLHVAHGVLLRPSLRRMPEAFHSLLFATA